MVGVELAIVVLGVHDDDEVGLDGEGPGESSGSHHHLYCSTVKQTLHQPLVTWVKKIVKLKNTSFSVRAMRAY